MTLEDSTTYQLVLNKGAALGEARGEARGITLGAIEEARGMVLRLGRLRFGPPPEGIVAAVQGVTDRERLELMAERLFTAAGWDDLIQPR